MGSKPKSTEDRWTETRLYDLIVAAHPAREWAVLRHVRDGGGWDRRTCDALAMGLWPSRGLVLRGFEIKVTRADFKREAQDPEKAEAVAGFCDEWWLVTPPGLVRDPGVDLPPSWGLMEPRSGGLTIKKKVTRLDPTPVSRGFLAQLFKGATAEADDLRRTMVSRESIQGQLDAEYECGKVHGIRAAADGAELAEAVEKFRVETGIDVGRYGVVFHRDDEEIVNLVQAARVGAALLGQWGGEWTDLLRYFKRASEKLATVHDRLATLVPRDK